MFSHLSVSKVFFPSPALHVDPLQVVNSLLNHSSCNLLHSRISRYSPSSSSRWAPFQNFSKTLKEKNYFSLHSNSNKYIQSNSYLR